MAKIDKTNVEGQFLFFCPGCGTAHYFQVKPHKEPTWEWNGNFNNPTITPSLKIWTSIGFDKMFVVCHSIITNGRISYCEDSIHALSGKTVDLPDMESI